MAPVIIKNMDRSNINSEQTSATDTKLAVW